MHFVITTSFVFPKLFYPFLHLISINWCFTINFWAMYGSQQQYIHLWWRVQWLLLFLIYNHGYPTPENTESMLVKLKELYENTESMLNKLKDYIFINRCLAIQISESSMDVSSSASFFREELNDCFVAVLNLCLSSTWKCLNQVSQAVRVTLSDGVNTPRI